MAPRLARRASAATLQSCGPGSSVAGCGSLKSRPLSSTARARRLLINSLLNAAKLQQACAVTWTEMTRVWLGDLMRVNMRDGPTGDSLKSRGRALFAESTKATDAVDAVLATGLTEDAFTVRRISGSLYRLEARLTASADAKEAPLQFEFAYRPSPLHPPSGEESTQSRCPAVDFVGLALVAVAAQPPASQHFKGSTSVVFGEHETPDMVLAGLPAVDALGLIDDWTVGQDFAAFAGMPEDCGAGMESELEQLCRIAHLTERGQKAVVGVAQALTDLLACATRFAACATHRPIGGRHRPMDGDLAISLDRPVGHVTQEGHTEDLDPLRGSTIGPHGDNLSDAVVLARLFLKSIRLDDGTTERGSGGRTPVGGPPMIPGPNYPAGDATLFQALACWRAGAIDRARRPSVLAALRRPINDWPADIVTLATITVGSDDWMELRREAGCGDQRLRVVPRTAIILIDRGVTHARATFRTALAERMAEECLTLSSCFVDQLSAAHLMFNRDTGQILLPGRQIEGCLEIAIDTAWIDLQGRRRTDPQSLEAIADAVPLAATFLIDRARAALAGQPELRIVDGQDIGLSRRSLAVSLSGPYGGPRASGRC